MPRGGKAPVKGVKRTASQMAVSDPATKQPQPKKNRTGSGNESPRGFDMDFDYPTSPLESSAQTLQKEPRARVFD
jgi:hypothetical protein